MGIWVVRLGGGIYMMVSKEWSPEMLAKYEYACVGISTKKEEREDDCVPVWI